MAEFTRAQHFITACHACLVCPQPIKLHQHPHLHPQLVADVYLNALERKDVHETRRDLYKIFTSKQNQLFKVLSIRCIMGYNCKAILSVVGEAPAY
uniref:Late blight resistance protein n=1 Tax=Solanum tuberosum TaxID=4113 RepID=M1CEE8_SOLTU